MKLDFEVFLKNLSRKFKFHYNQIGITAAVDEIVWKNIADPNSPQVIMWRTRIACWMPKVTDTHTHTECVILTVFSLQQWFHEGSSMLHSTTLPALYSFQCVFEHQSRMLVSAYVRICSLCRA